MDFNGLPSVNCEVNPMFSKVEFLVATGRRVALRGWRFDIGTYWLLKGCNYSFLDLRRGGDKCMFVHF